MPEALARANGEKSKVRAYIEHVFASTKGPDGSGDSNHWPGPSQGEDQARQSDLQHEARRLAGTPNRRGLTQPNTRPAARNAPSRRRSMPRSVRISRRQRLTTLTLRAVPRVSKTQVLALAAGDSWHEKGANLLLFAPLGASLTGRS
jgi:hypothetical protein